MPKPPLHALLETIEAAAPLAPVLQAAGGSVAEAWARVQEQKAMVERHQENLDYFARVYAPLGWTAFDQLSLDIAERLRPLTIAEGQDLLLEHFLNPDELRLFSMRLRRPAYVAWRDIAERAFERAKDRDFLSAAPLIFIVIDGMCQHHLHKSAFGGAADEDVFDTLTTAPNGLAHGLALAGKTRKKLCTDALEAPYRNGILHGRDTNFGHAIVAAKAINLLRATVDYIDKRNDEEERISTAVEDQRPPDWNAVLAARAETRAFRQATEAWVARAPREGSFATYENASGLADNTPESAAIAFLKAMAKSNYGKLAELTLDYTKRTRQKWAGDLRRDYGDLGLRQWRLGWLNDSAAAASELSAVVSGQWEGRTWSGRIELRMLYVDEDNDPLPRDLAGGRWVATPNALSEMWRLAYATLRPNE